MGLLRDCQWINEYKKCSIYIKWQITIEKNANLSFVLTWMRIKDIMVIEICQHREGSTLHDILFTGRINSWLNFSAMYIQMETFLLYSVDINRYYLSTLFFNLLILRHRSVSSGWLNLYGYIFGLFCLIDLCVYHFPSVSCHTRLIIVVMLVVFISDSVEWFVSFLFLWTYFEYSSFSAVHNILN